MKAAIPKPQHASYLTHRKQVLWQVILPILAATVLLIVVIVLICSATFGGRSDVSRWAAISTMWLMLPVMAVLLIFLVVLSAAIYLIARATRIIPTYTGSAQNFAFRVQARVKRVTRAAVKPIFWFDKLGAYVKALFGRK
jgi:uncharacterized membrane protein